MPVPGGIPGVWVAPGEAEAAGEVPAAAALDEPFPDPFPLGTGPRSTRTTERSSDAKWQATGWS